MAQTQLDYRLGSNNSIFDLLSKARISTSSFDYSMKHSTTIDIGGIYPLDAFRVYPRDDIRFNGRYILDSLPLVAPTMTNYIVRTYWYYLNMPSLDKGFATALSHGRSGKVVRSLPSIVLPPHINSSYSGTEGSGFSDFFGIVGQFKCYGTPSSLCCYLGVPPSYIVKKTVSSFARYAPFAGYDDCDTTSFNGENFPILPYFLLAYHKIYRFSFMNPNLLYQNKVWWPEDTSDEWRINYDRSNLSADGFFVSSGVVPSPEVSITRKASFVPQIDDNCVNLWQLRYAPFERDAFTTAKPWLVRGDEVGLDTDISGIAASIDFTNSVDSKSSDNSSYFVGVRRDFSNGDSLVSGSVQPGSDYLVNNSNAPHLLNALNRAKINITGSAKSTLTLNNLRALIAYNVIKERNTLTNGSYNAWQRAQWNNNPKQPDYEPYYLGGTSDVLNVGKVLQTSASDSGSTPLGTQGGVSSVQSKAQIFDFKVPDYGVIIGVMTVIPETVYSQGISRDFTDLNPDDWFLPGLAKLSYQPVLNQDIFAQGVESTDKNVFGYQTRFWYLKARSNRVSGLFLLPSDNDLYWSAYSQARHFSSLPALSLDFVTASPMNVRRDLLAYPLYPAFILQWASDVELIRALPYQSEPETFGF